MILWARTRRALPLALVLCAALAIGASAGSRSVVLPVLFGSVGSRSALTSFTPLLWGIAVADAFSSRRTSMEVRPAGRLARVDASFLALIAATSGLSFSLFATPTGANGFGFGSMLIVSGLACGVTLRFGPSASAFSVATLVFTTAVYGMDAPASRYVRVFEPEAPRWWSIGLGLLLVGWSCVLLFTDRVQTEFRIGEATE